MRVLSGEADERLLGAAGLRRHGEFPQLLARETAVAALEANEQALAIDERRAQLLGALLVRGHPRHDLVDPQLGGLPGACCGACDEEEERKEVHG